MKTVLHALAGLTLLAVTVSVDAQVPVFKGPLLLQPIRSSAKCMTAASDTNNAIVTLQTCTGSAAQSWSFAGGNVRIFSNKCLTVPSGTGTSNGRKLIITTCSTSANQKWDYSKWVNTLQWVGKNKCVDLPGTSTANGIQPQMWDCNNNPNQVWNTGYMANKVPKTSQGGQTGTNDCGTGSSSSSTCQTAWINSVDDFCLFGPPRLAPVGHTEEEAVAYCTKDKRGARVMPKGTITGAHFVKTKHYVQITGTGNFTKINVPIGDYGGELDNKGPTGAGNPIGGLVYGNSFGNSLQYHEWTEFLSDNAFCIRACMGTQSKSLCNHIYDIMGCWWNMPANYETGQFESCDGEPALPMGVYGTSTWKQGTKPTPSAHPAPASSNCVAFPSITPPANVKRDTIPHQAIHAHKRMAKASKHAAARAAPAVPGATAI